MSVASRVVKKLGIREARSSGRRNTRVNPRARTNNHLAQEVLDAHEGKCPFDGTTQLLNPGWQFKCITPFQV